RVSGRRYARAGFAGGREDDAPVWRRGAGERGSDGDGAILGACGEKRVVEMDGWSAEGAEEDVADAWRAGGGTSVAGGGESEVFVGRGGGAVPGFGRIGVSGPRKLFWGRKETFLRLASSI